MSGGDVAIVDCAPECRILLMNDANFSRYERGKRFFCREEVRWPLPASLMAPVAGFWNIVLEFGAEAPAVRHSIQIVRN
jgi:hypothetical protein